MSMDQKTLVIVGGVAGGASAAARARRANEHVRIIMYEKDNDISFANCGLPYFIGGEIQDREKLLVAKPALFRNRFNIEVHTHHEVLSIDRAAKTVEVHNKVTDERFTQAYDKLILAPGGRPLLPPMPGMDAPNVFTLRNLDDVDRIKAYLEAHSITKPVVVGAGFIGLEMVEQLHALGMKVALVEMLPQVLPPLDAEMAALVRVELEAQGIDLHLGNALQGLRVSESAVTGVELADGTTLDTDFVVMGLGIRPNTALAEAAGLDIGETRGIAVNDTMQTSDPDIYAVGDAVEYPRTFLRKPARVPLAGPANRAGRIAGEHAVTGTASPMPLVLGTAIVRVFDKTAASTGLNVKTAKKMGLDVRSVVAVALHHVGYYPGAQPMMLKLIYENGSGKVLGAQAVGGEGIDKRIDIIATAIQFDATVADLTGLDLTYAPPFGAAKDPVHMAAFIAQNDLAGFAPVAQLDADLSEKQVVDVRTPKEVEAMRLPYTIHIPVDELRDRLDELDAEKTTVVHCQSGLRSHIATRILMQHGFRQVKNLTGGMLMAQHVRPDDTVRGRTS